MKTRDYQICGACRSVVGYDDTSVHEYEHIDPDALDDTLARVDATLGAILADDPGCYFLESVKDGSTGGAHRCKLCDDDTMDNYLMTVVYPKQEG